MYLAQTLAHWRYGFDGPALGSQQTFQAIMTAMEHPGQLVTIHQNPDAPDIFNWASAATCLTLLDRETPVWIDIDQHSAAVSWLQHCCQSSVVTELCMANFAIVTKPVNMPDLEYFRVGTSDYPENATTVLIQVDDILPDVANRTIGIGFDQRPRLVPQGLSEQFWQQWRQLSGRHPLGIDIFITCEDVLIMLPKSNTYIN
jgi:alpha-D-ribose 1-methylphosphonate 5-triphosphate synthase subunit PhnH